MKLPSLRPGLLISLLLASAAYADPADVVERPGWSLRRYRIGPAILIAAAADDQPAKPKLAKGVEAGPVVDGGRRNWNVLARLKDFGVESEEAKVAIYDILEQMLSVYASDKAHDSLTAVLKREGLLLSQSDQLEFSLVEFEVPRGMSMAGLHVPELKKLAGKTWMPREKLAMPMKSGVMGYAETVTRAQPVEEKDRASAGLVPMKPGDRGIQVTAEPVLENDHTLHLNLDFQHAGPLRGSDSDLDVKTLSAINTNRWTGALIQLWSLPLHSKESTTRRFVALVLEPASNEGTRVMRRLFDGGSRE